jgi:signal-transduction protein with cAMP-binding, CBS, and nucleotidyltransferase domain
MPKRTNTRLDRGLFVDRNIDRIDELLRRFKPFLSRRSTAARLTDFDAMVEQTLGEIFGESSNLLEAYEYAKVGEAAGLVNLPEEAQENGAQDIERESLQQRKRVLESAISELETHRKGGDKSARKSTHGMAAVRVAEYMSHEVRSIAANATIKDAGRLLQKLKVGSLLVDDNRRYIGIITDTDLSRKAVARGLDPNTTTIKTCMSKPVLTIEDDEAMEAAVKMMKENGVRHLAVTEDRTIIGVLSVSDLLRYYSNIT